MASTPPNPASPSDADPDDPAGRARPAAATRPDPAGQPGTIRVVALKGGKLHELEGADALAKLPELLAQARLRRSGSTSSPRRQTRPSRSARRSASIR